MNNLRKSTFVILLIVLLIPVLAGCNGSEVTNNQDTRDAQVVDRQQSQYAVSQAVPFFQWSLPRHLLIQIYELVTTRVTNTYTIFSSNGTGQIYFECPSMGYAIPADTSLTNPDQVITLDRGSYGNSMVTIGLAEPNGVYASENTDGTWAMCYHPSGVLVPVYTELKVTTFPAPVIWDEGTQRIVWGDPETPPAITVNTQR